MEIFIWMNESVIYVTCEICTHLSKPAYADHYDVWLIHVITEAINGMHLRKFQSARQCIVQMSHKSHM